MSSQTAVVFRGDGRSALQRLPRPEPGADEVRIRIEGCGVCASNLPVWAGRPWFEYPLAPGAPGHEGWGEIDAVGPGVADHVPGERVVFLSGRAYAEYDVARASDVVRVPAAFAGRRLPGEPLACAMNVFRRSDIRAGQTVAIVGVGFIGALLVQLAAGAGARVIALTRRPFAREVARAAGAAEVLPIDDRGAATGAVHELTGGAGCPRVIEAGGEQSTLDLASAISAEGGRLIIAGYHQDGTRTVDMQQWNWRGLDVVNAHERDAAVVARGLIAAMEALEAGRLDPFALLTHHYGLGRIDAAFETMQRRPEGFLKATVSP